MMQLGNAYSLPSSRTCFYNPASYRKKCEAAGGLYSSPGKDPATGCPNGNGTCQMPAAPANVNVNVSPSINTTVSPQISPVFQQQYQPTNSPLSAGTSQTSPSGNTGASTAEIAELLKAQAEAQREAQAANMAMFEKAIAAQSAQAASQQAAQQSAPAVSALAPLDTYVSGDAIDTLPQMDIPSASTGKASATVAPASGESRYQTTMIMLSALGVLATYLALSSKGKSNGIYRKR